MTLFVIMGVTGDLSKKKLIPAIYKLFEKGKIKEFAVIGVSKTDTNSTDLLKEVAKSLKPKKDVWKEFHKRFYYFQADFDDKERFITLNERIHQVEEYFKLKNRIYYLATLPRQFEMLAESIKVCIARARGWERVVFEKPFGENLATAKKINKCIRKVFHEKQIYRVDHYLEKELVQNISVLRFTNTLIQPDWNNKFIDHIQIILSESFGVEKRGRYYDAYGAVKDVVQNHMLQLLALTTMQQPRKLDAENIRNQKMSILKKIASVKKKDIVFGQYEGYQKVQGVKKGSRTETFAAMKMFVNTPQWKGVPFYLLTGKNLGKSIVKIVATFKHSKCDMFLGVCDIDPNRIEIEIQPRQGFNLTMNAKVPEKNQILPIKVDYCHECNFGTNTPEAYENLFYDVILGNQSTFIRSDEIEEEWKIVDKILKLKPKVYSYKKGSIPEEANLLIQRDKKEWYF